MHAGVSCVTALILEGFAPGGQIDELMMMKLSPTLSFHFQVNEENTRVQIEVNYLDLESSRSSTHDD